MDISPYEDGSKSNKHPFPVKMVAYLSNYEVYEFLKDLKEAANENEDRKKAFKNNRHLSTVVYEATQYLKQTPCGSQTPEGIKDFITKIRPFGFTKVEQLMLLNTKPTQPVDIQALVEESEDRLSEEQVDEVIQIVDECLTPADEADIKQESTDE